MEKVFPKLAQEVKARIIEMDSAKYNELPNISIASGGEVVEILNIPYKKSKGNRDEIRKSDFVINSPKNLNQDNPILALPNSSFSSAR